MGLLMQGDDGETPISTQEYIRMAVENGGEDHGDFALDPWVCAVDFVRRKGVHPKFFEIQGFCTCTFGIFHQRFWFLIEVLEYCLGLVAGDSVAIGTPLCAIKNGSVTDRVAQVKFSAPSTTEFETSFKVCIENENQEP